MIHRDTAIDMPDPGGADEGGAGRVHLIAWDAAEVARAVEAALVGPRAADPLPALKREFCALFHIDPAVSRLDYDDPALGMLIAAGYLSDDGSVDPSSAFARWLVRDKGFRRIPIESVVYGWDGR